MQQAVYVAKKYDVEVSCRSHAEDETCAEETNERNCVRDLSHCGLERANGGRSDLFAGQSVDGGRDDDIDGCRDAFLDCDGAGEVTGGILHLSEDGGESLVPSEGESDVKESRDGLREIRAADGLQVERGSGVAWSLNTECDHDEEDRDDDAGCAWPGCPGYKAHRTGNAKGPHCDGGDDGECDCAGCVLRDGVETDSKGDDS